MPRLLLITPENHQQTLMMEVLEASLAGGVDAILLRKKEMDSSHLLALASKIRLLTRRYKAKLFIHTQADICLAVDADGVHLASNDIAQAASIRQYLGKGKSISASCHDAKELQHATNMGVDFALLSPVFTTTSHPDTMPLGVNSFMQLSKNAGIPVLGLGGINTNNRSTLAGYGVAVISSICNAKSPKEAALALL